MRSSCADGYGDGTLWKLTDRCSASRISAFMVDGYETTLCATRLTSDDNEGTYRIVPSVDDGLLI